MNQQNNYRSPPIAIKVRGLRMTIKKYRTREFARLSTKFSEYKPKIKIIKPDSETNWLDIEETELQQIIEILLAQKRKICR